MDSQVLLVDDNPIQASARQAILSRAGVAVHVAESARSALSLLSDKSFRESLGLLVTDHLMPGMNGPDLVRQVRPLLPDLPILVLSGLPDAEAEYPQGSVVFRLKPFPPAELIRLVQRMLNGPELRTA